MAPPCVRWNLHHSSTAPPQIDANMNNLIDAVLSDVSDQVLRRDRIPEVPGLNCYRLSYKEGCTDGAEPSRLVTVDKPDAFPDGVRDTHQPFSLAADIISPYPAYA